MPEEFTHYVPGRPQPKDLNSLMEFDHVIRVMHAGMGDNRKVIVIDESDVYAPEVYVSCAEDDAGSILADAETEMIRAVESQGWEFANGYSGQYLYSGPIMHASEFVGGRMAEDILDRPGLYVVVEVRGLYATEEQEQEQGDDPIGWVVCRKLDESE